MNEIQRATYLKRLAVQEAENTAKLLEYYRAQWEILGRAIDAKENEIDIIRDEIRQMSERRGKFSQLGAEIMGGSGYADFMADTLAGTGGQL